MATSADGQLAEYAALRQEIETRSTAQQNLFSLQLTAAGALFGFALSGPGRAVLVLIVPLSSYLLFARYLVHSTAIAVIGEYLRDHLEPQLVGDGWERYWRRQPRRLPFARWTHPNLLLFPGVSGLALAWSAPAVLGRWPDSAAVGLGLSWLAGLAVTVYSGYLVWTSGTRVFGPRYRGDDDASTPGRPGRKWPWLPRRQRATAWAGVDRPADAHAAVNVVRPPESAGGDRSDGRSPDLSS
jgi:hypothetical protein